MAAHLEDLPDEIVENIVCLLRFDDICSLRQASRSLAYKAAQTHFKSFFRSKHVHITEHGLTEFVTMTKPEHLGSLVRNLFLLGVVNNTSTLEDQVQDYSYDLEHPRKIDTTSDRSRTMAACIQTQIHLDILQQRQAEYRQLHDSGRDVKLLGQAFHNLAAGHGTTGLLSISLGVVVYCEDSEQMFQPIDSESGNWKPIWDSATDTFLTTLNALSTSPLPVEKFDAFGRLQRCSVYSNAMSRVDWGGRGLVRSFTSTKSLSISLSDKMNDDFEYGSDIDGESDEDARSIDEPVSVSRSSTDADESDFNGLVSILQLCRNLEDLDLHNCGLQAMLCTNRYLEKLFRGVAETESVPPKSLVSCRLRGIHTTEHELLAFLKRAPIRDLELKAVVMSRGSFKPIFDHCSDEQSGLQHLVLNNLQQRGIRHFAWLEYENEEDEPVEVPWFRKSQTVKGLGSKIYHTRNSHLRMEFDPCICK